MLGYESFPLTTAECPVPLCVEGVHGPAMGPSTSSIAGATGSSISQSQIQSGVPAYAKDWLRGDLYVAHCGSGPIYQEEA